MWLYGSGFPKSLDVSKAIDKMKGVEREDKFEGSFDRRAGPTGNKRCDKCGKWLISGSPCKCPRPQDIAVTPEAAQWQGWGTALKPAYEPIILARKPLESTVAANVLKHGTGGMNIDASRVRVEDREQYDFNRRGFHERADPSSRPYEGGWKPLTAEVGEIKGRWPANVILTHHPACVRKGVKKVKNIGGVPSKETKKNVSPAFTSDEYTSTVHHFGPDGYEETEDYTCHPDCPIRILDAQSGHRAAGAHPKVRHNTPNRAMSGRNYAREIPERIEMDAGGASRFFYVAKASREERERGLGPPLACLRCKREPDHEGPHIYNHHPTVKPIELMRYLVRLVSPPNGLILDPFLGSGTTLIAARLENMNALGIEKDPEMEPIIKGRLSSIPPPLESFE